MLSFRARLVPALVRGVAAQAGHQCGPGAASTAARGTIAPASAARCNVDGDWKRGVHSSSTAWQQGPPPPAAGAGAAEGEPHAYAWERKFGSPSHGFPDWVEAWGPRPFYAVGSGLTVTWLSALKRTPALHASQQQVCPSANPANPLFVAGTDCHEWYRIWHDGCEPLGAASGHHWLVGSWAARPTPGAALYPSQLSHFGPRALLFRNPSPRGAQRCSWRKAADPWTRGWADCLRNDALTDSSVLY